ncbi:methylated-DNA--[protein]-cysteine S-methyltransferase [Geminicoccus roseus]|uniref:methylated-DNA--[protein]-cysteine S-methyltransferase n=1 Tax=Geminicoccus roseus TaxID=404900 RepID=UPI0004281415|nr:methylated-DNA--[protein]-cysteine S-methyltransferase [Geminicoccus roseus]
MEMATVATPIGRVRLIGDGDVLVGLYTGEEQGIEAGEADTALLREACRQVEAFFAGSLSVFDLPLRLDGTEFQRRVWAALLEIPFGATISYKQLAERVESRAGFRAVGAANGRNPISIIVPCHRVINHDGKLGGYGGGLPRKRWLLDHEARFAGGRLI